MVVVDAVDYEVESVGPAIVCVEVKDKPVQPVLSQSPEQPAAGKPESGPCSYSCCGQFRQHRNCWNEDGNNNRWVDPREPVEQV